MDSKHIQNAYDKIKNYICCTPLEKSVSLSNLTESSVFLKCENMQYTGSFKVRGALNKVFSLSEEKRKKGIIAASTGNHGMATCYAALKATNTPVTIYVPSGASKTKLDAIKSMNGNIIQVESSNCIQGELAARKASEEENKEFLSPYNDKDVIIGQGTIALEVCNQLNDQGKEPDVFFVSVGGGGLISGISCYIKDRFPNCKIIGCQPDNSKVMMESINRGKILDDIEEFPTLSDGTAGGIEENSITFPIIQDKVDDFISVTENEIKDSLLWAVEKEHMLLEGAAAVVIASFLKVKESYKGKNVILVLCGRNISFSVFEKIMKEKKN